MDYQRIYNAIIERRKQQEPEGYSERHHIVPRSFGGTDTPDNLVRLTAREHFLCHYLLLKIHPTGRLHYKAHHAFISMLWRHSDTQVRYKCTARLYEKLKKEHAIVMSATQKGDKNSQYGKLWIWHEMVGSKKIRAELLAEYLEQGWYRGRNLSFDKMVPVEVRKTNQRKRMSISRKGKRPTNLTKNKISQSKTGKKQTQEHKKNRLQSFIAGKVLVPDRVS